MLTIKNALFKNMLFAMDANMVIEIISTPSSHANLVIIYLLLKAKI